MVSLKDFLSAIATPQAVAVALKNPEYLIDLLLVIIGLIILLTICWVIHFQTAKNKGIYKPFWKEPPFVKAPKGGRR